jgi:hypothetical protein
LRLQAAAKQEGSKEYYKKSFHIDIFLIISY